MSNNYKYKHKKQSTPIEHQILNMLGKSLWSLITLPFKKNKSNPEFTKRWQDIQTLMQRSDSPAWSSAIIKADSLLDDALKTKFAGSNLGERLKNARNHFTPEVNNLAWQSHILRNKIAHEGIDVSRDQAKQAIYGFRAVLNSLGAL